jgi:hypothetical protein
MKVKIVISWPKDPTGPLFGVMMALQVICTLSLWISVSDGIVLGILVTLLASAAFVGCFWKQEDLAYVSSTHTHRGVFVLLLTLLGISHTRGYWYAAFYGVVYAINTVYIVGSFLLASKQHLEQQQQ